MSNLIWGATRRILDGNGDTVSGGKIFVYAAGTTTPLATYGDSTLSTANTWPVVADASGLCGPIYATDTKHKIRVTDASDVILYEDDNVYPQKPATSFDTFAQMDESDDTYPEDTLIQVIEGGYTYKAAASGASDHHILTSGGSQKLYVLPVWAGSTGGIYLADAYGGDVKAACDHAGADGGGRVIAPSTYLIDETIVLKNRVVIDMVQSGIIEMTDDDKYIIDCSGTPSVTSRFGVVNGRVRYSNQQTTIAGCAIRIGKVGVFASNWTFENLSIANPYHGIYVEDGANVFLGRIGLVTIQDAANYATYFGGGASVHTHISIDQLWAYCTPGSEPSGSRGHNLQNIQALNAKSILADNVQGVTLSVTTCTGVIGTIQIESCDRSSSSGGVASSVQFSNSQLDIGMVTMTGNTTTMTAGTSYAAVSLNTSSVVTIGAFLDFNTASSLVGGGTHYAFYMTDTNSVLYNTSAENTGTTPAFTTNETSANRPKQIRNLNGVVQRLQLDDVTVGTKSTIPTTTDYAEFSVVINSNPTAGDPWGWRLIGSTWEPLQHVTAQTASADIDTTGFTGDVLTTANKVNAILSRLRLAGLLAT